MVWAINDLFISIDTDYLWAEMSYEVTIIIHVSHYIINILKKIYGTEEFVLKGK